MQVGAVSQARVRCHELSPQVGELSSNLKAIAGAIDRAAADGVDLLVLPELATSGYYLRDVEEAAACAISADGEELRELARRIPEGMAVVLGFCEAAREEAVPGGAGGLCNSAAVLAASGVLAIYRKTHLWGPEKLLFTPGEDPAPVVSTPIGEVGVLICYDLEFPEMPRALVLAGADIIAVPTNWPLLERPEGERAPEAIQAMAAARSSRVPIACCDRSGEERGGRWTEGTVIVGGDGWVAAEREPGAPDPRVDAVLRLGAETRLGPANDVLEDRRPALYRRLLRGRPEV